MGGGCLWGVVVCGGWLFVGVVVCGGRVIQKRRVVNVEVVVEN